MNKYLNYLVLGGVALTQLASGKSDKERYSEAVTVEAPEQFEVYSNDADSMQLEADWWTLFDDAELQELVQGALENNKDLAASAYRVDQARAAVGQARAGLFPQLAIDATGSRGQSLETGYRESNYARVPGVLGYEVDLWGGVRKGAKAARDEVAAATFNHEAYRLSISGQVAKTLFLYRSTLIEEGIVSQSVETRSTARDLISDRFELGSAAEFDLASAETELASAQADLADVRLRRSRLASSLALLVGEFATGFETHLDSEVTLEEPPSVPVGMPVEVIGNRPDVSAAELSLAAAAKRIGVARTAFYPSIRLTGTAGWESDDLDDLISSDRRVWSIGPQVYLPLFQGGRNKARLSQAVARFEENEAVFQQAVLTALQEVQSNLYAVHHLSERAAANDRAAMSARKAAELSKVRYDEGFVSYLDVVDSERTALAVERAQVSLNALRLLATVDLIQSLGGGWRQEAL